MYVWVRLRPHSFLKSEWPLGPRKEPRYTIHFSQKSRQTNPLQVPQKGPYREGGPLTGHFAYLSKISSFGFPSKGALPEAPFTEPLERAMPHPQSPFIQLSKSHVDEPSFTEPLERAMPHPQSPFIQLSKSHVDEPSSKFPKRSPYEKRCPSPEPCLNILQGPRQGSPPSRFPSQSSQRERERERERERDTPPPEVLAARLICSVSLELL
jgi:hypothetical protein